jgi:beta-aspartyl-peptidase (threonine type)
MATPTTWLGGSAGSYGVLVHGGAGRANAAILDDRKLACAAAAQAASDLLRTGASALDAVQRAVEILEDAPVLNAATGGALTEDGTLELDASIMEGTTLRAGAVCALPPFKHPIAIARAVLDEDRHVLYAADGARAFALERGFQPALAHEMITERTRADLADVLAKRAAPVEAGTVGAVARDRRGGLAAATSTGGITGKRRGRVGDSPILGAGNYADDTRGAVSCTGQGEGFLRITMASRVLAELQAGASPDHAAARALEFLQHKLGKIGGVIVVSPSGLLAWARSAAQMPCAHAWNGEPVSTAD